MSSGPAGDVKVVQYGTAFRPRNFVASTVVSRTTVRSVAPEFAFSDNYGRLISLDRHSLATGTSEQGEKRAETPPLDDRVNLHLNYSIFIATYQSTIITSLLHRSG